MILPSRRHLAVRGGTFGFHSSGCTAGIYRVEFRAAAGEHPVLHGIVRPPQQQIVWSKMPIVSRLRDPSLKRSLFVSDYLKIN